MAYSCFRQIVFLHAKLPGDRSLPAAFVLLTRKVRYIMLNYTLGCQKPCRFSIIIVIKFLYDHV